MRSDTLGLGRAVAVAMLLSMALSAVAARAASEAAGPPCSATVKDHCMEGASSRVATMRHKHVVRHHKPQTVMAKPASLGPSKPVATAAVKPKAK